MMNASRYTVAVVTNTIKIPRLRDDRGFLLLSRDTRKTIELSQLWGGEKIMTRAARRWASGRNVDVKDEKKTLFVQKNGFSTGGVF